MHVFSSIYLFAAQKWECSITDGKQERSKGCSHSRAGVRFKCCFRMHEGYLTIIRWGNINRFISSTPYVELTHWGRVTHICVVKLTIIGSDNGLSPGRRQAIIWTNAGILLIGPLGTNFIQILIGIQTFSFKKMHLKMSSAKWRPFYLGLNVLTFMLTPWNGNAFCLSGMGVFFALCGESNGCRRSHIISIW